MNNSCDDTYDEQIIRIYEKHLSPYGRKVMSTLLKLKKERKANNNFKAIVNPPAHFRDRNKVVLSFNASETSIIPASFMDMSTENNVNNTSPEFYLQSTNNKTNNFLRMSPSDDLLKPPHDKDSVSAENDCPTKYLPGYNNVSHTLKQCINNKNKTPNDVVNETSDDISWDNMFDTDILQCFKDAECDKNNKAGTSHKIFFPETVDINKNPRLEYEKCVKSNKIDNTKRITKIANAKVNKTNRNFSVKKDDKVNFRKEKYTTSIKNWLDDIDTTNIADDEHIDIHQIQENTYLKKITTAEEQTISKPLEKNEVVNKGKTNKRSIQAQLANKNGVMKYKKPKCMKDVKSAGTFDTIAGNSKNYISDKMNIEKVVNTIKYTDTKVVNETKGKSKLLQSLKEPNTQFEITKAPTTKVVKEKKSKAKFIAPLKSQIPVKNVTYRVVIINSLIDISEVLSEFEKIDLDEGVMVLVYSNGFSQLNRQHTDDTCSPEGIMFCFQDTFYYIEGHVDGIVNVLRRIISSSTLICFDAKSVLVHLMCQYEFSTDSFDIIDTKIGSSLISPDEPPEDFSEMQKLLDFSAEYTIATDCTLQKTAWYMTLLKECSTKLKCLLLEQGLWKVFADIEMKILPIIAGMEHRGICVDITKLKAMEDILLSRLKYIEGQCHKVAGKVFQINSAVQVRALIYDELKLDTTSNVKIRETICMGAKSTSEAMLRSLAGVHPLPQLILEYRHLHKAHATFVAGIAQHVRDGIVKPTWNQSAAATGRMASNNPNLQAIPRMPFNLHLFPSGDNKEHPALQFRSVYVARAGRTLLAADFRHVECRVFAHAAADAGLLAALESPDLFRVLAAQWLNKREEAVSAEDRERTKRIVYASMYGAGTRKLAEILGLGYEQVLSIVTSFNRTFPSLKAFGRSVAARCAQQAGRLSTASGRARTFSDISSSDFRTRSHAERQAVNFIIQGSAADLCKAAMAQCGARLRRSSPPAQAQLLLQIHDELVWEVLDEHLDAAAAIIKSTMENCGQELGIPQPLPVTMTCGRSWGEMDQFHPSSPQ